MLIENVYNDNAILEYSMQASALRNQVIQNNIANAELPNFKRSNVLFEDVLSDVVTQYEKTGQLDLSNMNPKIVVDQKDLSYRLDGNNVDMEAEMVSLYQNDAKYSVLASSVMNNYKRINLILSTK